MICSFICYSLVGVLSVWSTYTLTGVYPLSFFMICISMVLNSGMLEMEVSISGFAPTFSLRDLVLGEISDSEGFFTCLTSLLDFCTESRVVPEKLFLLILGLKHLSDY
jgi:hypothetical protein